MNDTDEKLPLLVNGQLDERERAELEQQLAENPELEQEKQFLNALHEGLRTQHESAPGSLGLARLKRDIARDKRQNAQAAGKDYWKPVALTACVLFGVQTLLVAFPPWKNTGTDIAPLGGEHLVQGPQLQVIFYPNATAAQIRTALLSVDSVIIDGPGALGVYTLSLPKEADAAKAMKQLAGFEFIEQVTAP